MIQELLKYICEELNKHNIEYMLSGSIALLTYSTPRMTRDIDIVINLKNEDAIAFKSIFTDNFYYNNETIDKEIQHKGMFNIIDQNSGFKLDFIVRKNTPFRKKEFERRQLIDDFGFPCWIVSKEDLILSKLIWIQELQSDTQKTDIRHLLDSEEIDSRYLNHWIKELNLNTFGLL
jgi:hypothetical protein